MNNLGYVGVSLENDEYIVYSFEDLYSYLEELFYLNIDEFFSKLKNIQLGK
ncbi:MAG: hypothetical protein ACTSVY_04300 [Candidatus Helarchaeota archaeon]